ncbi:MAG: gamma-glutamyl-gamma-aminobutyrate hydrolase family protein [Planctomycetaceae bacterium]|nr:gamma-glutamyl-gamma-aminobutyrate hydrolase family protein [Planctomycetaceae bacterium]
MNPPLIGITTYGVDDQRKFTLPREYVDSVRRAGGIPLLIAPGESRFDELLSKLDGVILAGGGDIDPTHYRGHLHETIYSLDEERDSTELALARCLIDADFPTLAICRGIQLVNVVQGGTLIEHLPDVVGESVLHRLPPREPTPHSVRVEENSQLAELLEQTEVTGMSWHHQAVRDVAEGFTVTAYAPDGTIEAMEMKSHRWLVAVQWHPELTSAKDPTQQRLFDKFVNATIDLKETK